MSEGEKWEIHGDTDLNKVTDTDKGRGTNRDADRDWGKGTDWDTNRYTKIQIEMQIEIG